MAGVSSEKFDTEAGRDLGEPGEQISNHCKQTALFEEINEDSSKI